VLAKIEQYITLSPRGVERVKLEDALGRVLAEDIYAPIDYPPFDRSEVDGYAVIASDTYGADELNPKRLKVVGRSLVGGIPEGEVAPGTAYEIDTGAPMPRGADAVVMEEHVWRKANEIAVFRSVYPGENVVHSGSDISLGELLFRRGEVVTPAHIAVMATLGMDSVLVYKQPSIAVISVGNELTPPGQKLGLGRIYDTNGYHITALLRKHNFRAEYFGIVRDNVEELKSKIVQLLADYDVVVTSGGTSAGLGDVVYKVFESLGKIAVHGVRVRPGKPTVIAVTDNGKILFGLPGHPFSAYAIAHKILVPLLRQLSGAAHSSKIIKVRLTETVRKSVGFAWLIPVVLSKIDGEFFAIPVRTASGSVRMVWLLDGIAELPEELEIVKEGAEIDVDVISEDISDTMVAGSHDIILADLLYAAGVLDEVKLLSIGSYAGLDLIARGYIDVAPIHLYDADTGVYNVPYLERLGVKNVVLVKGYSRRLVLAFQRGNPKNIRGFTDILRPDVVFVNRNRGSGTRIYIDYVLRRLAEKLSEDFEDLKSKIRGYYYEVPTHNAVAAAISQGRADAGVCSEYAAVVYGLDFIPLTWEEYDFAVNIRSLNKRSVRSFIDFLTSESARKIIESRPGYRAPKDLGSIVWPK